MKRYIKAAVAQYSDLSNEDFAELIKSPTTSTRDLLNILDFAESDRGEKKFNIWQHTVVNNILMNPNIPEEILRKYWEHGSSENLLAISMNPNAPVDLLVQYISHPGSRCEVASNPNLPEEAVQAILNRKYRTDSLRREWMETLALNPGISKELSLQIAASYPDKETEFIFRLNSETMDPLDRDEIADVAEQLITSLGYKYMSIDGFTPEDHGNTLWIFSSWIPREDDADNILTALADKLEELGYSLNDFGCQDT